jgi:RNA polymerase sigma factor (sigma-70 family)
MAVLDPNEIFYTAFEPKVQNRFIMYIDGIPSYLIKKAASPQVSFGDIKLDHINVYRKLTGKAEWADIAMDLYDPITPSGAQAVMEWVRLGHESVTGRDGYSDFYKKDITFNGLGPVGDIVNEWVIKGAINIKRQRLPFDEMPDEMPVASKDHGALDQLEAKEMSERITLVIDKLPTKCKQVFLLSRMHEMSYKEIAELMDISPKTVENQIGIALKFLRESFPGN